MENICYSEILFIIPFLKILNILNFLSVYCNDYMNSDIHKVYDYEG